MKNSQLDIRIQDYLARMAAIGLSSRTIASHKGILHRFSVFAKSRRLDEANALLPENRAEFIAECRMSKTSAAMVGFTGYLEELGILKKSSDPQILPDAYEKYIGRYPRIRPVKESRMQQIRKVLSEFHGWLTNCGVRLESLKIDEVDEFLKIRNQGLAPRTCADNRGIVKGFLRYLYLEKKVLKRDLGAMIVSAPVFAYKNPPRFLRPGELRALFDSMEVVTAEGLRVHAMAQLGYTTGLRPGEIANIRLDDISFINGELTVPERKGMNPICFPLPEDAVKAVAAYIIGGRPETSERRLFLSLSPPHEPVTGGLVSDAITKTMRRAGVPGTAYWLRHTYAQNLLESGSSIFEIKEMLGHDCIKATKRYLHVHIKLMREVLFDD
jgi:site-specific recombinase XerD